MTLVRFDEASLVASCRFFNSSQFSSWSDNQRDAN